MSSSYGASSYQGGYQQGGGGGGGGAPSRRRDYDDLGGAASSPRMQSMEVLNGREYGNEFESSEGTLQGLDISSVAKTISD